jgi:hypothetical protein
MMMVEIEHGVSGIARAFCERELRVPAVRLVLKIRGGEGRKEGLEDFVTSL